MRIRKNAAYLSEAERYTFIKAILGLKAKIANPTDPVSAQISVYDQFVGLHWAAVKSFAAINTGTTQRYHTTPAFFSWHRELLWRFENELRTISGCADVTIPYLDYADAALIQSYVMTDAFMGAPGPTAGVASAATGFFSATGPFTDPASYTVYPSGWAGFKVRSDLNDLASLDGGATTGPLRRSSYTPGSALTANYVTNRETLLTAADYTAFRAAINTIHGSLHNIVNGGSTSPVAGFSNLGSLAGSPNDPLFWLVHSGVDRLWSMWQIDGHPTSYTPSGTSEGGLNCALWPWDGGTLANPDTTGTTAFPATVVLPPDTASARTSANTLDHRNMEGGQGYTYDNDVICALAVDRTGSMTGSVAAPGTGSKWVNAKAAAVSFLSDCELQYTRRRGYVTVGAITFHAPWDGAAFTPSTAAALSPAYGLARSGSTVSAASLQAALDLIAAPEGNTPIGSAIQAAHTQILDVAYGNMPPQDRRALVLLTDGLENVGPLVSGMADGLYPNTEMFAMGFGDTTGGGASATLLLDIVEKGADLATATSRSYAGDTTTAVDKFFTTAFASAMGMAAMTDPEVTVPAGGLGEVPFLVNSTDGEFFVAATGADRVPENWAVSLIGPDGTTYAADATSPLGVTVRTDRGRTTFLVCRGAAPDSAWVGPWAVRVAYKRHLHHAHGPEVHDHLLAGPDLHDRLVPAGAPPRIGPRRQVPTPATPAQRLVARRGKKLAPVELSASAVKAWVATDRGTASVNVFHRGLFAVALHAGAARWVGDAVPLRAVLDLGGVGKVREVVSWGRLLAPGWDEGAAWQDRKTVPVAARTELVDTATGQVDPVAYMARYEQANPGFFRVRDEVLRLAPGAGGALAGAFRTEAAGVHHAVVTLRGVLDLPGGRTEAFERVLSTTVRVAVLPDPVASRPTVHWLRGNRFVVSVVPRDVYGNVCPPGSGPTPVVLLDGVRVHGTEVFTGTAERRIEIAPTLKGRQFQFKTADGRTHAVKKGASFQVHVEIGGRRMEVCQPCLVLDPTLQCACHPQHDSVLDIPIEERVVYRTPAEAAAAGVATHPSAGPADGPSGHDHAGHDHGGHDHDGHDH